MIWTVHKLNARGGLDHHLPKIEHSIAAAYRRIATRLAPTKIDIVLGVAIGKTIPGIGHTGYCPQADLIHLTFDPTDPACHDNLGQTLQATLAHEVMHAIRWDGPGYGCTLGEALVSEGLALHFEHELFGTSPSPWENALSPDNLRHHAQDAETLWDASTYDHAEWFFGAGERENWTGYTIASHLIRNWQQQNPGATASGAAQANAAPFRKYLRDLI